MVTTPGPAVGGRITTEATERPHGRTSDHVECHIETDIDRGGTPVHTTITRITVNDQQPAPRQIQIEDIAKTVSHDRTTHQKNRNHSITTAISISERVNKIDYSNLSVT